MGNQGTVLHSEEVKGSGYSRHVIYLCDDDMVYLEGVANRLGVRTRQHGTVSVSAMIRLVCTGYLRIVRSGKFYRITESDSLKVGVNKDSLLGKRGDSHGANELV